MMTQRTFIRGTPALLLFSAVGVASLLVVARALATLDHPETAAFFAVGLLSGYFVPLTFRIAAIVGPERVRGLPWLRAALLALFFLPLLTPLVAIIIAPHDTGTLLFAGGTLAMATLGSALQGDPSDQAPR